MANKRTYPYLLCRDLGEAIAFYEALGIDSPCQTIIELP